MNPGFRKEVVKRCEKVVWPDWVQRTGQPEKAKEYIEDCVKYRKEFLKMSRENQKKWLISHAFPKEALE